MEQRFNDEYKDRSGELLKMNFAEDSMLIFSVESWNDFYELDKSKIHVYIDAF